jgi:SpoVK/Ycf46/Vps4 family AAA+-type ATPase
MDSKSILAMSFMGGKTNDVFSTIIQTIMLSSMAHIEKIVGNVVEYFNKRINKKIESVVSSSIDNINTKEPQTIYSLTHVHNTYNVGISYIRPEKESNVINMDMKYLHALLHTFTKLRNIDSLHVCKDVVIPKLIGKSFEIKDGIQCVIEKYELSNSNELQIFKATISSTVYDSSQIFSYIKSLVLEQEKDKTSEMMNELYVFTAEEETEQRYNPNFVEQKKKKKDDGTSELRKQVANAKPELQFKTTIFHSNRKQENIKGSVSSSIFKKLNFFINNRKWYSEKGIPYHFTCMLTGSPGLGKTSCVKAAANKTKRHLFIVNCGQIKTSKQFTNLFTKEEVTIKNETGKLTVKIPIENRIYVLEELDILGDILGDRRTTTVKHVDGALSLDDFLNVFDGNIESPGRIIFITSNFPERLDRALTRGGRVDIIAKFTKLVSKDIVEYIRFFNDDDIQKSLIEQIYSYPREWYVSYADICQILFSKPDDIYSELIAKSTEKQNDLLNPIIKTQAPESESDSEPENQVNPLENFLQAIDKQTLGIQQQIKPFDGFSNLATI